jgi:uncharacterized protein
VAGPQPVKVVVTGPVGAGKTTFISSVSEVAVLSTERDASDQATRRLKARTTVAMDFGRITIDQDLVLYLFGTPGQQRFDFMWEILSEGMLGYVVLLDLARPASLDEAAGLLDLFRDLARAPFVVAANKGSLDDRRLVRQIRGRLSLAPDVPLISCDARDRQSVKETLLTLFATVAASLGAEPALT